MFLKRLLLGLFVLGVFAAQDSFAITCRDAVKGTCMHYSIGDGSKDKSYEVDNVYPDFTFCGIYRPSMGVYCTFDINQCPVPPPAGDPHNFPGVAYCLGCGSSSYPQPFSINEAKCCLKYGQPLNPSTQQPYC